MTDDAKPPSADDRRLDEMTAALREAGAAEAQSLPPEVRRSTLQALWVADAGRYERSSARNERWLRLARVVAVVLFVFGLGVVLAMLGYRSWVRSLDPWGRRPLGRLATPPATMPATAPATQHATQHATAEDPSQVPGAPPRAALPGAVVGRVVFLGTPPTRELVDLTPVPECRAMHPYGLPDDTLIVGPGGGLANVVVSVERADGTRLVGETPSAAAVLDQKGCRYVPHVLAVTTGQPIQVKNSDPFLHNVHALANQNIAFNFGQPNIDPGRKLNPMKVPERFKVKCDVHPWMSAWVHVFDHTYFAVTGNDGAFSIPAALPDGQYTVTAWHEKLGEKQALVLVKAGTPATADFVFEALRD